MKIILFGLVLVLCCALHARAQQASGAGSGAQTTASTGAEQRVPLAEQAVAFDALGRTALAGRLLTPALGNAASSDAPVRNARLVLENRSADFYRYVSGWATFYDAAGTRCGEGLFKLDALAPQESAETDTPGLRLTCVPAAWRIVALNLLTRAGDTARPIVPAQTNALQEATQQDSRSVTGDAAPRFVDLNIDGRTYHVPIGSTREVPINRKRTRITVTASAQ
jgi:hypothetical protein